MSLDVRKHEKFQHLEWRWQRAGWLLLTLFVLAGLLGLLGTGPLSWTTVNDGAVTVELDRVTRHEADDSITFVFGPEAVQDGTITAELTGDWPSGVDLSGISPEPSEQLLVPGGMVLEFMVDEPGETEVSLSFRAQRHGTLAAELAVGSDSVAFSQFVMP
ncbi:hypothetical protein [Georgenia subflava]|uniref:Uncharacterized protein n=1 Tax=Georgenia subflava TaxID=1622177 RepID=A0A6N7EKA2_9MICO|nr:hypothetical protein [Georgenia subflava]MPV36985.1 hypothetical protein [Georgenia subflava]